MHPATLAAVIEGAIPFFGGLYGTLLAYRVIGKKPRQDARVDEWHLKYGRMLKVLGPLVALFGVFLAVRGLVFGG
jgi:hypothetical protein